MLTVHKAGVNSAFYGDYWSAPRTGHMAAGTRRLIMPCSFSRIFKKCLLNSKPSPYNTYKQFTLSGSETTFNTDNDKSKISKYFKKLIRYTNRP